MKEKYRTDEAYRLRESERGKLKYIKVKEQRRLDTLAKEAATTEQYQEEEEQNLT